jgi:acetyl-CoA acetyltransferase
MELRNCVIVDGMRSAFARGGRGKLEAACMDDAAATIIREIFKRNPKVKPTMVEDLGIGHGFNLREVATVMEALD